MARNRQEILRKLPQVHQLLENPKVKSVLGGVTRQAQTQIIRKLLAKLRDRSQNEAIDPTEVNLLSELKMEVEALSQKGLRRVVNATGVILHTNLGRAPLEKAVLLELAESLGGYCTLEVNQKTGERGTRTEFIEEAFQLLLGSEDYSALVVNNGASAIYLMLHALAAPKKVLISRGEIVQIGGGFKIHEVLEASGAELKEVGTTNITQLRDYEKALDKEVRLILKVHQSCYSISGHTKEAGLRDLSQLSRKKKVLLIVDLGSGGTVSRPQGDPTIQETLRSGADLVSFSGDKLLGASQAGIIVGRSDLIKKLKASPLYRALRLGKLDLFVLERTLRQHLAGETTLTQALIDASADEIKRRANALSLRLGERGIFSSIVASSSSIGGGTTPRDSIPTHLVQIAVQDADIAQRKLLAQRVPVYVRKAKKKISIDLRTVLPWDEESLVEGLLCLS